jgi:hypothetical protein
MKFEFNVQLGSFQSAMQRELGRFTEKVMADTLQTAQKLTPKQSGRARSNWKKAGTGTASVVKNGVPYIQQLDRGSSRQAPGGITGPTLTEIRRKYK